MQLGQYPEASHIIVHISDTHFRVGGAPMHSSVDADANLLRAMTALEASGIRPDALIFTGDLADTGDAGSYARVRAIVEPVAHRTGARLIWVMGNHDRRAAFSAELLAGAAVHDTAADPAETLDRVYDLDGLRVIALDSSVPGYDHGELSALQLEWLADQLAVPARRGTVLAIHHPPLPTPIAFMQVLELQDQPALARVLAGTDVRGILAGHLHYAAHGSFAGIPVSVAASTCYTIDAAGPAGSLVGRDGGQSLNLVHVYDDQLVHSIVPLGDFPVVAGFDEGFTARLEASAPEERLDMYSRHPAQ
jgi:Icc protein